MEKINIAELLKNCPKGMELDCTMFDNVTFVRVDMSKKQFPIEIAVSGIHSKYLTKEGCFHDTTLLPESKCVIFPKGKTTWEGFHSPFKDGDVIYAMDEGKEFIFILKHIFEHGKVYCYLSLKGDDLRTQEVWLTDYNPTHRHATEEEKQKLFDAIKANGYKWNAETKTLEKLPRFKVGDEIVKKNSISNSYIVSSVSCNYYGLILPNNTGVGVLNVSEQDEWELVPNKFDITTLKPFDRVLVRDTNGQTWNADLFSHIIDNNPNLKKIFVCAGHYADQCVPYEGNEHLLGTNNDCDEFYKTWKK